LAAYGAWFPEETIFVCVIDPGVGSNRRCIAVEASGRWYVGPDNGLLSLVAGRDPAAACWNVPVPQGASPSFHGRDVFAPAAVAIGRGEYGGWSSLAVSDLTLYPLPNDLAEVAYVDHFGNLVTGLRDDAAKDCSQLRVGDVALQRAATFSDVAPGTVFWYRNSSGLVEIAANGRRADEALGVTVGTKVELVP